LAWCTGLTQRDLPGASRSRALPPLRAVIRCWRIYPMAAPESWICVWPRARPPWPTMPG